MLSGGQLNIKSNFEMNVMSDEGKTPNNQKMQDWDTFQPKDIKS